MTRSAVQAIRRRAKSVELLRGKASGSYVSGIWVAGTDAPISIKAVVQPASGEERELLPQGIKDGSVYTVWTESEILEGDAMIIEDDRHVVVSNKIRRDGGFWRATFSDQDGGK